MRIDLHLQWHCEYTLAFIVRCRTMSDHTLDKDSERAVSVVLAWQTKKSTTQSVVSDTQHSRPEHISSQAAPIVVGTLSRNLKKLTD